MVPELRWGFIGCRGLIRVVGVRGGVPTVNEVGWAVSLKGVGAEVYFWTCGDAGMLCSGTGRGWGCWRGSGLSYGHLEFFSETLELREWVRTDGLVLGWNGRGGGGRIGADSSPGDSVALVGSGR